MEASREGNKILIRSCSWWDIPHLVGVIHICWITPYLGDRNDELTHRFQIWLSVIAEDNSSMIWLEPYQKRKGGRYSTEGREDGYKLLDVVPGKPRQDGSGAERRTSNPPLLVVSFHDSTNNCFVTHINIFPPFWIMGNRRCMVENRYDASNLRSSHISL